MPRRTVSNLAGTEGLLQGGPVTVCPANIEVAAQRLSYQGLVISFAALDALMGISFGWKTYANQRDEYNTLQSQGFSTVLATTCNSLLTSWPTIYDILDNEGRAISDPALNGGKSFINIYGKDHATFLGQEYLLILQIVSTIASENPSKI